MIKGFTTSTKEVSLIPEIKVEVVYALPEKQYLFHVILRNGATVKEVVQMSGLLEVRKDIDLTKNKVGIYSHPVKLTDIVRDGDRIEIYRQLISDQKDLRWQRAKNFLSRSHRMKCKIRNDIKDVK